jgi:hypothetical protein
MLIYNHRKMKKIIISTFLLSFTLVSMAQLNLVSYHMRNNTILGQQQNATFFPKSKFYLSLPGISNINLDLNSPVSYSDLFEVTGDSVKLKLGSYLNSQSNDYMELNTIVPVLGFGFRINEISNVSFFINNRTSLLFGIPKDLARWGINGNGEYLDEVYEVDDIRMKVLNYAEIGVGYTRDITIAGQKFKTGLRLKYLAGIGMAEIDNKSSLKIQTNSSNYQTSFTFQDANLKIAGMDLENNEPTIASGEIPGQGFALDFGAEYLMSDKWSFNFALNDLGFINWKKGTNTISISDKTFVLEGQDIGSSSFQQDIQDDFKDAVETDTVTSEFKSTLGASTYLGAKYQVIPHGYASATFATINTLGKIKTAAGIGYTQELGRVFAVSTTVSKTPQQPIDMGLGMSLLLGGINLHIVGDRLIGLTDATKIKKVNFSFGLNILIGNPNKIKELKGE